MNGYNEIIAEPSDDEDLAIACGFEIITEDELYNIFNLPYQNLKSSSSSCRRSNGKDKLPFVSGSTASASSSSSGVSSMMKKPMSSCSLSSQGSELSDVEYYSTTESEEAPDCGEDVDAEDEHQLSVENLWYMIQQKRHLYHELEEEMRMSRHHFMTMEHASHSHNRLTEWFANLIHFPEKLRQIAADKHRFNIDKIPKEVRDELKHIYVY